ncbi:MAG: hypothetical protein J5605_02135 [Bacteroidales bacterium]|nr:hypothetical protein [Bacteroidales bacterium]
MDINTENYELYLFRYAEGLLTDDERLEVEAFLQQHKDLQEELSLYDPNLKIAAQAKVVFSNKNSLKHKYISLFPAYAKVAVAASISVLLAVGAFVLTGNTNTNDNQAITAHTKKIDTSNATETKTEQILEHPQNTSYTTLYTKTETPIATSVKTAQNNEEIATSENTVVTIEIAEATETTEFQNDSGNEKDTTSSDNDLVFISTPQNVVYTDQLISYSYDKPHPPYKNEPNPMQLAIAFVGDLLSQSETFREIASSMENLQRKTQPGIEKLSSFLSF